MPLSGLSFVYLDQVYGKIDKSMRVAMKSHSSCHDDQWKLNGVVKDDSSKYWAKAKNLTQGLEIPMQMLESMGRGESQQTRRQRDIS